jgi:hypothetical protein
VNREERKTFSPLYKRGMQGDLELLQNPPQPSFAKGGSPWLNSDEKQEEEKISAEGLTVGTNSSIPSSCVLDDNSIC